jgi:hypothetical protein
VSFTEKQLCKVLRKTGNDVKIAEAKTIYFKYWSKPNHDEHALECGHELGCLYQDQNRSAEAILQLQRVWEERRDHKDNSERKRAMLTVDRLLSILATEGKKDEMTTVLEYLWKQHTGGLAGTMLTYADDLAGIYMDRKDYEKAYPIYEALWAVRSNDLTKARTMKKAEKDACLSLWFRTGDRCAVALMNVGGKERLERARSAVGPLWNARAQLPAGSWPSEMKLADDYAFLLLALNEPQHAEEVAGKIFNAKKNAGPEWEPDKITLRVGERYAKALDMNKNLSDSQTVYAAVFEAWKKLSGQKPGDKYLAERTIKCGHLLLGVAKRRGNVPKFAGKIQKELDALIRASPSGS